MTNESRVRCTVCGLVHHPTDRLYYNADLEMKDWCQLCEAWTVHQMADATPLQAAIGPLLDFDPYDPVVEYERRYH